MANKRLYENSTDVMLAAFVQPTDPVLNSENQVLANKVWIDTSGGGWVWKRRNSTNTGWITKSDSGGGASLANFSVANFSEIRTLDRETATDEDVLNFLLTLALDLGAQDGTV